MQVKKIGVGSATTMGGLVYAGVGTMYAIILFGISMGVSVFRDGGSLALGWEFMFLIMIPIVCGLLGAFLGGLMAALYNFFALKVGGVLIELE